MKKPFHEKNLGTKLQTPEVPINIRPSTPWELAEGRLLALRRQRLGYQGGKSTATCLEGKTDPVLVQAVVSVHKFMSNCFLESHPGASVQRPMLVAT